MGKYFKILKNVVCCLLLFVVAICFCGCAQINASTISNADGSVDEVVTITLNRQELAEAGYDYLLVQNDIADVSTSIVLNIIKAYKDKVAEDIKYNVNMGKLSMFGSGLWDGDSFKIGLHFKDLRAYKFWYGITDETQSEPNIEKHFLYDKIIIQGYTLYASYNNLYSEIYNYYSNKYPLLADQQTELTYTQVLEYRREKSDADYVKKVGDKYYHTWKLNEGETDKVITIYYNLANRGHCILVCILISFAVCAILLLIGFVLIKIKNKKKKV